MAESDSPRFGLRRWSAGTDTPSRAEFDTGHANIDLLAAIDKQGTFAARPAAGVVGTYYWDTTNEYLWRDNGVGWFTVGSKAVDNLAKSSGTGAVPLTVDSVAAQVANLLEVKMNGALRFSVTPAGNIVAVGTLAGTALSLVNDTVGQRVIDAIGANGQTADMLRLRNFAAANLFTVSSAGAVSGAYLNAASGAALIGDGSPSTAANMTKFSGTSALEVRATTGGADTTFTDFLYLKHTAPDATAVLRRLGIVMKVGAEAAGDAGRMGAIYIESSAANFGNPKLVLHRADGDVMTFDSTPLATVHHALTATGVITATPTSDFAFATGNARIYTQGSHMALRAGSSAGFYFYSNSSYSSTPADPGSGSLLATLSSAGLFTLSRVNVTSTNDATETQANPAFMVGSAGSTNLIFSTSKIQARNNSIGALLTINGAGGSINIGSNGAIVDVVSGALFKIGGRRLTIQNSAPSSPITGDVWIDT